jgi:chromosome partitioning protein
MIISVVNQKGGTGKTTVATNLAACFAGEGQEVLVIDADPQRSALDWRADRPGDQPQVQAVGLPARNLHQEIEPFRRKYDVILIDGGGRITATARAAVMAADFVVIPILPSKPDILSTQDFFQAVIEEASTLKEINGAVLLNQVQTGTLINRAAYEQLTDLRYPLFETVLHFYVTYKEAIAAGLSVIEYNRRSKAATEMLAFFTELKEILR